MAERVSRREFVSRAAQTAVAVAGASTFPLSSVRAAVLGANDRLNVAIVGIRGQGNVLKRGFARLPGVVVKTLCDVDENLFAARAKDERLAADVPQFKPSYEKDLRRVLDDKDIDAVVIGLPGHWHGLASVWALEAGKHVFVEKPLANTVWEGRQVALAARRYKKIVQTGFMNRSRPAVRAAVELLHGGGIGEVYLARGLCFKPRPSIGLYPDGPLSAGETYRLTVDAARDEPRWDAAYLAKVDYDLWQGPIPRRAFNRNRFHYNWHWHWDYGGGDSANQGAHQFDIAYWGLKASGHPVKIQSIGGLYADPKTSQETPNVLTSTFQYRDGKVLEFSTRGTLTNDEAGLKIGNLFYGTKGWLWIDGTGTKWQSYLGSAGDKGPGSDAAAGSAEEASMGLRDLPHYRNFVDAVRAGDGATLTAGVEEGHITSALPHLGNIAYRLGRALTFEPAQERFVSDPAADALLTREYHPGFAVPSMEEKR